MTETGIPYTPQHRDIVLVGKQQPMPPRQDVEIAAFISIGDSRSGEVVIDHSPTTIRQAAGDHAIDVRRPSALSGCM